MKSKLKFIIILVFSTLVLLVIFFAYQKKQNAENISKKNSQELVLLTKRIQENVQLINLEKDYETKTLNNEKFLEHMTDGGGQLVGYYKDGKIKKIVERLGLSYGVKTYEYYFLNEQLISVNEKEEDFPDTTNTGTLDYSKVELAFEGHYYFSDGKLIETKNTGKKRFLTDVATGDLGFSFVTMAKQNVELLSEAK